MGELYTEVLVSCLTGLDEDNTEYANDEESGDVGGLLVGLRYIEQIARSPVPVDVHLRERGACSGSVCQGLWPEHVLVRDQRDLAMRLRVRPNSTLDTRADSIAPAVRYGLYSKNAPAGLEPPTSSDAARLHRPLAQLQPPALMEPRLRAARRMAR
ncbi:hypothetical protein LTS09_003600 [Friedmanniomyces endolithicus]|nr:hypothetical protein LTS09_003600 [Friedmanniomyces endolithicus]